ncbi:DNA-damage-inducible protein F [compost metagenome]
MWSYLLDGLFIGATRAREMRDAMLIALVLCLPVGWALRELGNNAMWLTFLCFMLVRSLTLGAFFWRLQRRSAWVEDE